MTDKIDSYMLCSELALSTAYEFQSTISFGQALHHQKFNTQEPASSQNHIDDNSSSAQNQLSLQDLFQQYLKDPLSTYTLQLQSLQSTTCYRAIKTPNQQYGQYTTSLHRSQFQHSLQTQDTLIYSQPSEPPKPKLTKLSDILKIIQNNNLSHPSQNPQTPKKHTPSKIKIQEMESNNLNPQITEIQKSTEKPESQVFLGLESNIFNNPEPISQKHLQKNTKSQNEFTSKQPLSPVPQNPQKKILKILNSNQKTVTNLQKSQKIISGLEFTKKLRKKHTQQKLSQQNIKINPFQLSA